VKTLNHDEKSKTRIRSAVWDFLNSNKWKDVDDFSLNFSDGLYETLLESELSLGNLSKILEKTKTTFFQLNKISKKQFANTLLSDIGRKLIKIAGESCASVTISQYEIFPKMKSVSDSKAKKHLKDMQGTEKFLQDSLRRILREEGGTPIPQRKEDTAQEVADIEIFKTRLRNRMFRFAIVVKGYKSVSGKTLTWKDVAHQVMRAYQRGRPDHVILASGKDPVDGLITNLEEYAQSTKRPNLVIFIPPLDFTKILLAYGCLKD
jgi:hypothetical protein